MAKPRRTKPSKVAKIAEIHHRVVWEAFAFVSSMVTTRALREYRKFTEGFPRNSAPPKVLVPSADRRQDGTRRRPFFGGPAL